MNLASQGAQQTNVRDGVISGHRVMSAPRPATSESGHCLRVYGDTPRSLLGFAPLNPGYGSYESKNSNTVSA
jgi:hypothetical protein